MGTSPKADHLVTHTDHLGTTRMWRNTHIKKAAQGMDVGTRHQHMLHNSTTHPGPNPDTLDSLIMAPGQVKHVKTRNRADKNSIHTYTHGHAQAPMLTVLSARVNCAGTSDVNKDRASKGEVDLWTDVVTF